MLAEATVLLTVLCCLTLMNPWPRRHLLEPSASGCVVDELPVTHTQPQLQCLQVGQWLPQSGCRGAVGATVYLTPVATRVTQLGAFMHAATAFEQLTAALDDDNIVGTDDPTEPLSQLVLGALISNPAIMQVFVADQFKLRTSNKELDQTAVRNLCLKAHRNLRNSACSLHQPSNLTELQCRSRFDCVSIYPLVDRHLRCLSVRCARFSRCVIDVVVWWRWPIATSRQLIRIYVCGGLCPLPQP